MDIKIKGMEITKKSRKMSSEELQEHLKNSRQGVGVQSSKKAYNRKHKYSKQYG